MKSTKGDESLIIVMAKGCSSEDVAHVIERLESIGAEAHVSEGKQRTVIGAVGDRKHRIPGGNDSRDTQSPSQDGGV